MSNPSASPSFSGILSPRWFFIGVAIGFLACIGGGYWASRQDIYGDRERFFFINPTEESIYPTFDNLCAFVRGKVPKNKKLILVAGDSRMLGMGQTDDGLWTRRLQEKLGNDYGVANVAFRGASTMAISIPMLEALSKEYEEIILIVATQPRDDPTQGFEGKRYDYILWDAWIGGKMANNPQRDQKMRSLFFGGEKESRDAEISMSIFGLVENLTHAADLWNYIGYNLVFTCSTSHYFGGIPFYAQRRRIPNFGGEQFLTELKSRKLNNPVQMENLIGMVVDYGARQKRPVPEADIDASNINTYDAFISDPKERKHILFLETEFMPFLVNQLSPDQRRKMEANYERWANLLRSQGFHVLRLGKDYDDTDYWDSFQQFCVPEDGGRRSARDPR